MEGNSLGVMDIVGLVLIISSIASLIVGVLYTNYRISMVSDDHETKYNNLERKFDTLLTVLSSTLK